MIVPKEQIIDTSELYYLKNQRKLSLRFLAWALFEIDIQGRTHDSIEDAQTALLLYEKYLELEKGSEFDQTLKKIYELGRQHNWLPPTTNTELV